MLRYIQILETIKHPVDSSNGAILSGLGSSLPGDDFLDILRLMIREDKREEPSSQVLKAQRRESL